jgi:hypothetical protein
LKRPFKYCITCFNRRSFDPSIGCFNGHDSNNQIDFQSFFCHNLCYKSLDKKFLYFKYLFFNTFPIISKEPDKPCFTYSKHYGSPIHKMKIHLVMLGFIFPHLWKCVGIAWNVGHFPHPFLFHDLTLVVSQRLRSQQQVDKWQSIICQTSNWLCVLLKLLTMCFLMMNKYLW